MSNIRQITAKKKITRNQYLLDIIKLAKDNIDKDAEIEDLLLIGFTRDGKFLSMGQTLSPTNPLTMIGLLDFAKINAFEAVLGDQPETEE